MLLLLVVIVVNLCWPLLPVHAALALTGILAIIALRRPRGETFWAVSLPLLLTAALLLLESCLISGTIIYAFGPLKLTREGWSLAIPIAGRLGVGMLWIIWFRLTTSVEELDRWIRRSSLPVELADVMRLMLRYLAVFGEECGRFLLAVRTRGGFAQPIPALQSTATVAAGILLRAYDRGERVSMAMALRGDGVTPSGMISPLLPLSTAVRCEHLEYRYPDGHHALHDMSLSVAAGEILAVLGANGSGKTTLLKVLCGVVSPSGGTVEILSRPVAAWGRDLWREVGLVMQDPLDQVVAVVVEDDVAFGPRNLGLSDDAVHHRVEEALSAMHIADLRQEAVRTLSYGQLKRVAIAGVLAMHPRIMLLDEPTAGLDPICAEELLEQLHTLNQEYSPTIIMTTHDVDRAARLASQVAILLHGRLWRIGAPRDVLTDPRLREAKLLPPGITAFWQRAVGGDNVPVSVEEAVERYRDHVVKSDVIA